MVQKFTQSVTPEYPGLSDIFKLMFIDHDGDQIRIDAERCDQGTGKIPDYCTFLLTGKSLSHPDNYYRHAMFTVVPEL